MGRVAQRCCQAGWVLLLLGVGASIQALQSKARAIISTPTSVRAPQVLGREAQPSPEACCRSCRLHANCTVWNMCQAAGGCQQALGGSNVTLRQGECKGGLPACLLATRPPPSSGSPCPTAPHLFPSLHGCRAHMWPGHGLTQLPLELMSQASCGTTLWPGPTWWVRSKGVLVRVPHAGH